ncbi:MAG TPA: YusW family protein [Sporosarcina sp.]|nr:YusW family protein [Sporosarcina sp.]
MMKKLNILIALFALSLFLVACGSKSDDTTEGTTDNQQQEDVNHNDQTTGTEDDDANEVDDQNDDTSSDDGNASSDSNQSNENQADNDNVALMEKLDYREFELEVEYADDKEYEAELELNRDQTVKAKIEDELNGNKIEGPKAFEQLYPMVESVKVEQGTSKEEAIKQVLDAFMLDANYEKFKLDISFHDGTEIEFEDRK